MQEEQRAVEATRLKKPLISERKLRANRANARRSTGPKTLRGKKTSSRNATRHGVLSLQLVNTALGESFGEFYDQLRELIEEYQPVGLMENLLVEKMATAHWKLARVQRAENGELSKQVATATAQRVARKEQFDTNLARWDAMRVARRAGAVDMTVPFVERVAADRETIVRLRDTREGISFVSSAVRMIRERAQKQESMKSEEWGYLLDLLGMEWIHDLPPMETDGSIKLGQAEREQFITMADGILCYLASMSKLIEIKDAIGTQAAIDTASLPSADAIAKLTRYEAHYERIFYRAKSELERLQSERKGKTSPQKATKRAKRTSDRG